jgi:hypothetical protein
MMAWKHLRIASDKLPPLLIKATLEKHGYTIKLTDLSRIWVETLSRDEIITRARRRNCSIDPGEDSSQQKIFLDKLQSALNQHVKTNLSISATNDDKLRLHLEASLPSPLPTFEWEVDLERSHDSDLSAELVSPLLHQAHILNHRMELLIAELQAKDNIITKVIDRLETSGHDLTAVFPGASKVKLTRSTSQQEQLARHIRGLGKFDEEAWKAQLSTANDTAVLPQSAEDTIFASLPHPSANHYDTNQATDWWQQIPVGRHIDLEEEGLRDAPSEAGKVSDHLMGQETSDPDVSELDGFQRQGTPPRLRSHSPLTARQDDVEMGGTSEPPALYDEDSTDDEDDLDRPSQKPSASYKRAHHNTKVAQVSVGSLSTSPPPASTSTAQPSTTRGPFSPEEDTEDDGDDDLDGPSQSSQKAASTSQLASRQKSQTPQPAAPTTTTTKSSPRKTLGKLGGRLPTKSTSKSPTPPLEEALSGPPPPTKPSSPDPQPKPKAKLGMIGGSKAKTKAPSPPPPTAPATSTTRTAAAAAATRHATSTPEPQPRPRSSRAQERQGDADNNVAPKTVEQTEVERADAKRKALKRELEQKAKAPVKKKRKF